MNSTSYNEYLNLKNGKLSSYWNGRLENLDNISSWEDIYLLPLVKGWSTSNTNYSKGDLKKLWRRALSTFEINENNYSFFDSVVNTNINEKFITFDLFIKIFDVYKTNNKETKTFVLNSTSSVMYYQLLIFHKDKIPDGLMFDINEVWRNLIDRTDIPLRKKEIFLFGIIQHYHDSLIIKQSNDPSILPPWFNDLISALPNLKEEFMVWVEFNNAIDNDLKIANLLSYWLINRSRKIENISDFEFDYSFM